MSDGSPSVLGLAVEAMPVGWTPLEAVTVVKCLDEGGETALLIRMTEALRAWDAVGMLPVALDRERDYVKECFVSDDDADEED